MRVLLPEPEGPMMAMYSPSSTRMFTSWSTGTLLDPEP